MTGLSSEGEIVETHPCKGINVRQRIWAPATVRIPDLSYWPSLSAL
jgi:hypothetical protein